MRRRRIHRDRGGIVWDIGGVLGSCFTRGRDGRGSRCRCGHRHRSRGLESRGRTERGRNVRRQVQGWGRWNDVLSNGRRLGGRCGGARGWSLAFGGLRFELGGRK